MKTNYSPRAERDAAMDGGEPAISFSHIFRILHEYRPVILVSLLAFAVGYAILAIVLYLFSASTRVTSLQFRLNFEGASAGQYPNGMKFSPVEIVSTPILQRVYRRNDLGRFMTLDDFSRSMFVLESNPAYNALAREYEARLTDSKLTTLDRERIQKEFDMKRDALSKNVFSLNFERSSSRLPESTVRNVLVDTLNTWADVAVNEQHAVEYQVAVLSPDVVGRPVLPDEGYLEALLVLRSQIMSVLDNVGLVRKLPGAELVRTADNRSLDELRLQLEEIIRFRIDPLVAFVTEKHLIKDPSAAVRFAQNELAYDQRVLDSETARAEAARQSLAVYSQRSSSPDRAAENPSGPKSNSPGEALMPQLSETFLDRLVDITGHASDVVYRQSLVDAYRKAAESTIPTASAVAYDKSVIEQLRSTGPRAIGGDVVYVRQSTDAIRAEVRQLIGSVNEIYKRASLNLRPSTQLFTMTAPAVTRTERTGSAGRLFLGGVLVLLVSFVLTIAGVLLHSRVREEEAAEDAADAEASPMSTPA